MASQVAGLMRWVNFQKAGTRPNYIVHGLFVWSLVVVVRWRVMLCTELTTPYRLVRPKSVIQPLNHNC